MSDDLKMGMEAAPEAPELTLEVPEAKVEPVELTLESLVPQPDEANLAKIEAVGKQEDAEMFRMQNFTEEEQKQITDFAEKIDLHDTNVIVSYGAGAQKRLSEFSDSALEHVRNKDIDQVGDLISDLIADLKYDPDEKKGLFGKLFNYITLL